MRDIQDIYAISLARKGEAAMRSLQRRVDGGKGVKGAPINGQGKGYDAAAIACASQSNNNNNNPEYPYCHFFRPFNRRPEVQSSPT